MVEFTPEQEAEIQRRIEENTQFEQWRVAFVQGFRLVLPYLEGLTDQYDPQTNQIVKRGAIDQFVVMVFKKECEKVVEGYFPQTKKPVTKEQIPVIGEEDV
jgi:hypothetical protein